MEIIDKHYLYLQFWLKIHEKSSNEFQSFFENIMQSYDPTFRKIRPYGSDGDGGNDGYFSSKGIYYQVFSPLDPALKDAEAAKKWKRDFKKLKDNWDEISTVKEYYFVFNDKNFGTSRHLEKTRSELQEKYPEIKFEIFTPKNLESTFFSLKKDQILNLEFSIDSTNAINIGNQYLERLLIDLDRDNPDLVFRSLEKIKDIILGLNNDDLTLELEIIEAMTLQKLEDIPGAREKYENLVLRFPKDPRPILQLAEIALHDGNLDKNEELLQKAEKIDKDHWLLKIQKLVRKIELNEKVEISEIDEEMFSEDKRVKSNFYRLYSHLLEGSGHYEEASRFIAIAINLNPNKFSNHLGQLFFLHNKIYTSDEDTSSAVNEFLNKCKKLEEFVTQWGGISTRNMMIIQYRKFHAYSIINDYPNAEMIVVECFNNLLKCYFNNLIDIILEDLMRSLAVPRQDFLKLLEYLSSAENKISENLSKSLILQFNNQKTLLTEGKDFFEKLGYVSTSEFITNVEENKFDEVWEFLSRDHKFALAFAATSNINLDLCNRIIGALPNDLNDQKDKLLIKIYFDQGNIDKAFEILKTIDLEKLNYIECRFLLNITIQKDAADFVVILINKILKVENDRKIILHYKLQLFTAYFKLEKYSDSIQIGEKILDNKSELELLDEPSRESLLQQTILARFKRLEYAEALALLEKCLEIPQSENFILGVKTNVYLKNGDAQKALESLVEGIKVIKIPTPEQYASLMFLFTQIGNLSDFQIHSLEKVEPNCFVKLSKKDRWYYLGNECELDAQKITSENDVYSGFIDKKIGEEVVFRNKYSSQTATHKIEHILSIDKYINWQCQYHIQQLTVNDSWDGVKKIEMPPKEDSVDTKYLIAFLEDERKNKSDFFDMYCKQRIPLAFLATSEGGPTNAIGVIISERKGFINSSSGGQEELDQQKTIAKAIINGEGFYIDGTSALLLSETGLLEEIFTFLPQLKIPQSVITLLLDTKEMLHTMPGQLGHMWFAEGKLGIEPINYERRSRIDTNFAKAISLLESDPERISVISSANKFDDFIEREIYPSLCDACILAQREHVLVLTEDYLYLQANELVTKKQMPQYCSAFALIRVLYELGKIDFDKYLSFFSYLSHYRSRFLSITVEDLNNAILGDGEIKKYNPDNIYLFNFELTLSPEYGVPFDISFRVVTRFLVKLLLDDTILPDMVEKIFANIVCTFPTEIDKRSLSQLFLKVSVININRIQDKIVLSTKVQEKVNLLSQYIDLYFVDNIILPNSRKLK